MSMDADAKNMVNDFFEAMKSEAEHLVFKIFPERIRHLNDLLVKPEFRITFYYPEIISSTNITDDNVVDGEKIPNDDSNLKNVKPKQVFMACNKKLSEFMDIVKPHVKQLIEDINALKVWISILIPKMEDGNNFGVEVQEQALDDIYNIEKAAHCHAISFVSYYENRARLMIKIKKYPEIEDYQKSVKELDEQQKITVSSTAVGIRDYYITLLDSITKNLDKIKKPRTNHFEAYY